MRPAFLIGVRAAWFFQRRLHQSKCEQQRLIVKENLYSMLSGYLRVNSAFVSRVQTQAMLYYCNGVEIRLKERA